jgi:copper chaperone CopZ
MITTIKIDNLKCHGCAHTITSGLLKTNGVSEVKVDHDTSSVQITHNDEATTDLLRSKLSSMGYPEFGTTSLGQKAKSYVSCAIGRLSE